MPDNQRNSEPPKSVGLRGQGGDSPSPELKIAKGLALPVDFATKTAAILAQRRKGKTYTANVLAEEFAKAGQPWVALDPTGAWWGLRSSADGKREGIEVLVVGGQHGQLPLERSAGKVLADLVVDEPGFYVFDLSAFESKAAEREFATAFAERLYRRKGKQSDPLHLFVDEADVFVPQRSPAGDQRMLGAFEAIVRRGGIRGLGTTLISQRAAVVNKNVLEQIDVLIALRTVGPNDQKALKAYIDAAGATEEREELMGSLASLALGEAWVWEPGAEPALFERVQIRERETFNSSATPKAGGKRVEPRKLADVDLDAIEEKIADTIERAKAEDPAELRKQIKQLKAELARRPAEVQTVEIDKTVEVPVVPDGLVESLRAVTESAQDTMNKARAAGDLAGGVRVQSSLNADSTRRSAAKTPRRTRPAPAPVVADIDAELSGPERKLLSVLLQHPEGCSKAKLALASGYSAKGGSFNNTLGKLRTKGLASPGGVDPIEATAAAAEVLPDVDPLPTGEELLAHWLAHPKVGKPQRLILEALWDHPSGLSKDELGEVTGYEATGGSFNNALGSLRTLGLISPAGVNPISISEEMLDA